MDRRGHTHIGAGASSRTIKRCGCTGGETGCSNFARDSILGGEQARGKRRCWCAGHAITLCSMPGAAPPSLAPVLRLPLLRRLPLHVARRVRPAAGERHDVIHHVAGPAAWMAALSHEIVLRCLAPVDSSRLASRAAGRGPRVRRVGPRFGRLARAWTLDVWRGVGTGAGGVSSRVGRMSAAARPAPTVLRRKRQGKHRQGSEQTR